MTGIERQGWLHFILSQTHPEKSRDQEHVFRATKPVDFIAQRLQAALAAEVQLRKLSDEDLKAEHDKVQEQYRAGLTWAQLSFPFNRLLTDERTEYWGKMPYWSLDEAAALVLGRSPDAMKPSSVQRYLNLSPIAVKYTQIRELISRAISAAHLTNPIFAGAFLPWSERYEVPMPPQLVDSVKKYARFVGDWKTNFDQLKAQRDQQIAERDATLAQYRNMVEQLRIELAELRARNQALPTPMPSVPGAAPAIPESPIPTKERDSLLKLVHALVVIAYRNDPAKARTLASEIAGDMARINLPMSDDTVRKYVREAADRFGREDIVDKAR